jgi:hypothetical protein
MNKNKVLNNFMVTGRGSKQQQDRNPVFTLEAETAQNTRKCCKTESFFSAHGKIEARFVEPSTQKIASCLHCSRLYFVHQSVAKHEKTFEIQLEA